MTLYDSDEHGNIIMVFDSRWADPKNQGINADDPLYDELKRMYQEFQPDFQKPKPDFQERRENPHA